MKTIFPKHTIAILLVSFIIMSLISGCVSPKINEKEPKSYNVTVQGAVFGGADEDKIKATVSFDPSWITESDNKKYNGELAAFAAILCDDVYFRLKDVDRGTQNRVIFEGENEEEYDWTAFLKEVGFSDVRYIESYKAREYTTDTNDSATMILAHAVAEEKYDLFAVAIRGCFSAQEWVSIYDPGCPDESYTDITGQHPEWTDKTAYKGLDIAKNRAMDFINEFINEFDNPDYDNRILVTGHSRGGAIANMIGAEMEDRDDFISLTYTFNAPGVTVNEKAKDYLTIFNIFDENDYYINPMPFANEKFYRYGRDISVAIADSEEIKAEISLLKGRDDYISMTAESKAEFAELFGKRFADRASLYIPRTVTRTFDTEEEALAIAGEYLTLIGSNGLGLEPLCCLCGNGGECLSADSANPADAVVSSADGKYDISMSYCDGALLIAYAKALAYGNAAYQGVLKLFSEDIDACAVIDLLMANADALNGGHLLINSYVLSRHANIG